MIAELKQLCVKFKLNQHVQKLAILLVRSYQLLISSWLPQAVAIRQAAPNMQLLL